MNEKKEQALFEYDAKLSISEAIPMGLQHVVAAVVGIVTPGIMIAKVCQLSPSDTTILIQTSLIFFSSCNVNSTFPYFWKSGFTVTSYDGGKFCVCTDFDGHRS
ncbi:hypothetical protein EfsSVR2281_33080 [Enterococcus faecalis]|nr:hypothetical protein EfsSVR2281_33080 [Enterococcus faecalis]